MSESAIFIQIYILPKIDYCQNNRKFCQNTAIIEYPILFLRGVLLKIWCSSKNFKQTIILCNHFHFLQKQLIRPEHVKTVLSFVGYIPSLVYLDHPGPSILPSRWRPFCLTSGVCQDSFRNPRAGKSRICQVSICRFD